MGTLIKKKGSFPLMAKKTVNKFFDDFITQDFDWSEKKFSESGSKTSPVNLKETYNDIKIELETIAMSKEDFTIETHEDSLKISSKNEVNKKERFISRKFDYRSFCRLPTL